MNYLQDRKTVFKNQAKKKTVFNPWFFFLVLIGLLVFGQLFFTFFSSSLNRLASPILNRNTQVGNSLYSATNFFRSKTSLLVENRLLQEELLIAQSKIFDQKLKLQELAQVAELLPADSGDLVSVGQIVSRPTLLPYDVFILKLPDQHQVSSGQKVMWQNRILLGEIVQVDRNLAKVKLYSSSNVKRQVLIGAQAVPGVLEGQGGGNFIISLPRGVEIPLLATVNLASNPTKVLGVVEKIINKPENPSQTIYVRIPINIYNLNWLAIYDF